MKANPGFLSTIATAIVALFSSAVSAAPRPIPNPGEQVLVLQINGAAQRVLYDAPAHPRATIVMLPGGSGDIGLDENGGLRNGDNFVVRTRGQWVTNGYAVVIPDTIDHITLRGRRSSPDYAGVVEKLIAFAHTQAPGVVFLLGTSQGAIAAMSGAARAEPGSLAGVILTESVSVRGHSRETVFDAAPQDVQVPALVVANLKDACNVAPPSMAPRIVAALAHAPIAELLTVDGGIDEDGKPCGSRSPHGYFGIEASVVDAIVAWMRKHGG